jgi:hypothetical protein
MEQGLTAGTFEPHRRCTGARCDTVMSRKAIDEVAHQPQPPEAGVFVCSWKPPRGAARRSDGVAARAITHPASAEPVSGSIRPGDLVPPRPRAAPSDEGPLGRRRTPDASMLATIMLSGGGARDERLGVRRQIKAAPVGKDEIARENMHLPLAAAPALDDVSCPHRDPLRKTT